MAWSINAQTHNRLKVQRHGQPSRFASYDETNRFTTILAFLRMMVRYHISWTRMGGDRVANELARISANQREK